VSYPAVLIPPELVEMFESGVSILVGTRDASLMPDASRAVGAVVHRNRHQLTIFLPTDAAERALANIRDNGHIAVAFSSVLDHRTTQVKGRVVEDRPATEEEREICAGYRVALGEVLGMTGLARAVVRGVTVWPSTAITLEVQDLFQQTPGPGAGERLEAKR
jgi:hypothetical protein